MKLFAVLLLLITQLALAVDIKIEVDPKEPVLGDSFNVIFKIESKDNKDPEITFDPQDLQVDGKSFAGRSTRTTFFNGKLSTESTLNYNFQLTPLKAGNVYLKNIKVKINDQVTEHKTVRIRVLKKPRVQKPLFLVAETSKEQVYVGESVIVNYYVYGRVSIQNFTIKKFPKLNHLLKRYQPERNNVERVSIGNQIYQRRLLYSAQVFPEKPGQIKVDSMELQVQYAASSNNPFGSFGLNIGPRSIKNTTLRSKTVNLNVLPLPTNDVPKGFTGLVGEHKFQLEINKSKFLLNEPLEIKLKVEGPGALENMDAPSILTNAGLEEFDTKANLELSDNFTGTKTFEYVYLTRSPFKESARTISLSYFDPETTKYESVELSLPEIEVVGQAIKSSLSGKNDTKLPVLKKENENFFDNGSTIIAPVVLGEPIFSLSNVNLSLLIVILFLFAYKNKGLLTNYNKSDKKVLLKDFLDGELTYAKLINILKVYDQNFNTFKDFLKQSHLNSDTKKHLEDILLQCEQNEFSKDESKKTKKIKIKKKYLKQFIRVLENG